MQVTIYTLSGCQPCALLKTWMKREDIPFTEKSVKADRTYLHEFKQYQARGFPLTIIEKEGKTYLYEGYTSQVKEAVLTMKKDFSL